MYDSVLVPTDGGPGTEGAVTRALDLGRAFDATVHALSVIDAPPVGTEGSEDALAAVEDALEERGHAATIAVQERAEQLDVEVVREIRTGTPYWEILAYADEADVGPIVMATRARQVTGERPIGSTTERVLVRADVPVVATGPDGTMALPSTRFGAYDRVVIPTDGSDAAERAAEHGLRIAERYGADVRVVYVVDTTTYGFADAPRSIVGLLKAGGANAVEAIVAMARERNLSASTAILRGRPDESILQYVAGADGDLLAMGTRGQADGGDYFLGSTTARVLRRASVPVMAVS